MPQLHAGASARPLLSADLRSGAGEIQRGEVTGSALHRALVGPRCVVILPLLTLTATSSLMYQLQSGVRCAHTSDALSLPPVTGRDKPSSRVRPSH